MSMEQRYEFFAPIWRVMRDDNMSVEEVRPGGAVAHGQWGRALAPGRMQCMP